MPAEVACRTLTASEFARIRTLARDACGLDLRPGKETLVSARLNKLIRKAGCRSAGEYHDRVREDASGESLIEFIDALTTNHTSFFREQAHFDFVRSELAPVWRHASSIRIWSAACSTGEEPYSIAMCLLEELGPEAAARIHILATDISTRALERAARAIYPEASLSSWPREWLRKFWLRGEGEWAGWYRIRPEVRATVEFRRWNLLDAVPPVAEPFPLVFCRNVMIYFDKPVQSEVTRRLAACLEPGGYLFTGHSESLTGISHGLRYVLPAIYRKGPGGAR